MLIIVRNITAFAILVIMICCARPVCAQNAYAFSFSPQFGFCYGQAEEIVYPSPQHKAEFLSQLLWDVKPVFYYGISLDFSRAQPMSQWGFFTTLSVKNGFSGLSGKMEDRDWMSTENSALTHYSIHDSINQTFFLTDVSFGVSFPLYQRLLLRAFIGTSYMRLDFSGIDGQGTYARENPPHSGKYNPIGEDPWKTEFTGTVITYAQQWFYVTPGVSARFYFLERFFAELSFSISPLIWCVAEDQHLTSNVQYQDHTGGGIFIEPELHFSFIAHKQIEISLDCSWRFIQGTRGETYQRSIGSKFYAKSGEAGTGLSIVDTGLCAKIRL